MPSHLLKCFVKRRRFVAMGMVEIRIGKTSMRRLRSELDSGIAFGWLVSKKNLLVFFVSIHVTPEVDILFLVDAVVVFIDFSD